MIKVCCVITFTSMARTWTPGISEPQSVSGDPPVVEVPSQLAPRLCFFLSLLPGFSSSVSSPHGVHLVELGLMEVSSIWPTPDPKLSQFYLQGEQCYISHTHISNIQITKERAKQRQEKLFLIKEEVPRIVYLFEHALTGKL